MSEDELIALLELEARGEPGPWAWKADDKSLLTLGAACDVNAGHVLSAYRCNTCSERGPEALCMWPYPEDAELIIAARNHFRALLEEVLALRALLREQS